MVNDQCPMTKGVRTVRLTLDVPVVDVECLVTVYEMLGGRAGEWSSVSGWECVQAVRLLVDCVLDTEIPGDVLEEGQAEFLNGLERVRDSLRKRAIANVRS